MVFSTTPSGTQAGQVGSANAERRTSATSSANKHMRAERKVICPPEVQTDKWVDGECKQSPSERATLLDARLDAHVVQLHIVVEYGRGQVLV